MSAILKSDFSVFNAENFINSFLQDDCNLYLAVGRGYTNNVDEKSDKNDYVAEATKDGEFKKDDYLCWEDESNPPTPRDTIEQEKDLRNNMIMLKRVKISNICLMVPRIEWKVGLTSFKPINDITLSGKRAHNYFCINSENEVWQCVKTGITNNKVNATVADAEPMVKKVVTNDSEHPAGNQITYNGSDGYIWKFMYDIKTELVNNGLLLDHWMPVPYGSLGRTNSYYDGSTITELQEKYGDRLANETLGAYRVLISVSLDDEDNVLPYDSIYRQVALIVNPRRYQHYGKTDMNNVSYSNVPRRCSYW